jgi:hypothetical protein
MKLTVEEKWDVAYDLFLDSLDKDLADSLRAMPHKGENSSPRIAQAQLFRLLRELNASLQGSRK